VNKGIAIVRKNYTREEIEGFTTYSIEAKQYNPDFGLSTGNSHARSKIFELKMDIENEELYVMPDLENFQKIIVKYKIDW
jgi:hypothetical protein